MVVGKELDVSWRPYLPSHALDFESTGTRCVLIRHDIVASILEVTNRTTQLGFVDLTTIREQLQDQEA